MEDTPIYEILRSLGFKNTSLKSIGKQTHSLQREQWLSAFEPLAKEYATSSPKPAHKPAPSSILFDPNDLGHETLGEVLPICGSVLLRDRLTPLVHRLDRGDRYPAGAIDPRDVASKLIYQLLSLKPLYEKGMLQILPNTKEELLAGTRMTGGGSWYWVRFEDDLPLSYYDNFIRKCRDKNWNNPTAKLMARILRPEIDHWASKLSGQTRLLSSDERLDFLRRADAGAQREEWIDESQGLDWPEVVGWIFRSVFLLARGLAYASELSSSYFTEDHRRWELLPPLIDSLPVEMDTATRRAIIAVDLARNIEILSLPNASFREKASIRSKIGPAFADLLALFKDAAKELSQSYGSREYELKKKEIEEHLASQSHQLQKQYYATAEKYLVKVTVTGLATVLILAISSPINLAGGVLGVAALLHWLFDCKADLDKLKSDPLCLYALHK